jgi:hypothetical protein
MKAPHPSLLAALAGALLILLAHQADAGCRSDADCKSGRVCEDGECVAPRAETREADSPADTVFLKGGGRLRGQVMEEDPVSGVRIKLPDGQVRTVPADKVDRVKYGKTGGDPSPPAALPRPPSTTSAAASTAGTVRVSSTEPGTVFVDGGQVGKMGTEGFEISGLTPGLHRVKVEFDSGGSGEERVTVSAGSTADVSMEASTARQVFRHREGAHWGIGVGPFLEVSPVYKWRLSVCSATGCTATDEKKDRSVGGGAAIEGLFNFGLAPAVDFRASLQVGVGGGIQGRFAFAPSALVGLRFNLGSIYTMAVGFRAGVAIGEAPGSGDPGYVDGSSSAVVPHFGPEVSILSFRFGESREFELDASAVLLIPTGNFDGPGVHTDLTFRYLFLD